VSVHTDSGRVLDKLRRKEEKRQARAGHGSKAEADWDWLAAAGGFAALVEASAGGKRLIDGLVGTGDEGLGSLGINARALPKGTVRKSHKGYEEVSVPATPTAEMLPNERLIKIEEMDDFAQLAFEGYKTLNRIQVMI
jgi:activating signal cointegrator complex subunit 3